MFIILSVSSIIVIRWTARASHLIKKSLKILSTSSHHRCWTTIHPQTNESNAPQHPAYCWSDQSDIFFFHNNAAAHMSKGWHILRHRVHAEKWILPIRQTIEIKINWRERRAPARAASSLLLLWRKSQKSYFKRIRKKSNHVSLPCTKQAVTASSFPWSSRHLCHALWKSLHHHSSNIHTKWIGHNRLVLFKQSVPSFLDISCIGDRSPTERSSSSENNKISSWFVKCWFDWGWSSTVLARVDTKEADKINVREW